MSCIEAVILFVALRFWYPLPATNRPNGAVVPPAWQSKGKGDRFPLVVNLPLLRTLRLDP